MSLDARRLRPCAAGYRTLEPSAASTHRYPRKASARGTIFVLQVLAAIDVHYRDDHAIAASVLFRQWTDDEPAAELVRRVAPVALYEPGSFYKRELPCLLDVLRACPTPLECIVIDGYVWLSEEGRPGLGARLFESLGRKVIVVGVAKSPFRGAGFAEKVLRGRSARPLFVTAAGLDAATAAERVRQMHGAHRIPTLLQRADRLSRTGVV